jgi:aspartyl-tRNA(Asn)/glutamyl-tRNA(Gln) amidotransferase subunit A
MQTLPELAAALAAGRTSARDLVEQCLARIADPAGEGGRTFLKVHAAEARAMADAMDGLRRAGRAPGPYAGIPISLKDLLDIKGEPTPGGSRALANAPPAATHAVVVQRLLAAGFVPLGRTNMTEFAYSGLGLNPHYGTPRGPWDRPAGEGGGRVPGGSSSGAAVSIADGMAFAALGTDTGGSCRIPAAMCGIVGYKPTARRVPLTGVLPLSSSLDSVGPLANSVACCAIVDAVLAGAAPTTPVAAPLAGLRLAVPSNFMLDGMDATVGVAFEAALSTLARAGARIEHREFPALDEIRTANASGGFSAAESFAWHRRLLAEKGALYDPRVRVRIAKGEEMTAADYVDLIAARAHIIHAVNATTAPYDALVMPTVPVEPPRIDDLAEDEAYGRTNMLLLRNTAPANFLDRCAISLPCHRRGEAPVGLMLMGETQGDARLFAVASAVEAALA